MKLLMCAERCFADSQGIRVCRMLQRGVTALLPGAMTNSPVVHRLRGGGLPAPPPAADDVAHINPLQVLLPLERALHRLLTHQHAGVGLRFRIFRLSQCL